MTVKETLAELEALGDEKRRKHNIEAGAPENEFGVKLGDIRALAKNLGCAPAVGDEESRSPAPCDAPDEAEVALC